VLVLTQPDRPAGRGMKLVPSAVKQLALQHRLPLHQPVTLKQDHAIGPLLESRPEVLVVAAYGMLLPPAVLNIAPLGAVNIHASLLPRWRGAAPIQRALFAGDPQTGISIMQMDAGLDTGPVWSRHPLKIEIDDDAGSLHDRLAALGASAIVSALEAIARGDSAPEPQPAEGVTYAHKITKADQDIDWRKSSIEVERAVRALRPAPGARTQWRGELLKLWAGDCVDGEGEAGSVLQASAEGIVIACARGALRVKSLQRAGGNRMTAAQFLGGSALTLGERLGAAG
jgi:methionyl-tRNA formyltransferase